MTLIKGRPRWRERTRKSLALYLLAVGLADDEPLPSEALPWYVELLKLGVRFDLMQLSRTCSHNWRVREARKRESKRSKRGSVRIMNGVQDSDETLGFSWV